ncbi:MAG: hypothetical protein IT455_19330 [Planctomycetes bacterium]|nr:hypothetical protein [Planctomycetota bacterium]
MGRGSWPFLLVPAAAVLFLFWFVRAGSDFLAIEADAAAARVVAAAHGLTVAEAMALRDGLGVDADHERWRGAAARFAAERARLGEAFAAVFAVGDAAAVRAALAATTAVADAAAADAAWREFRRRQEALPGLRFLAMRERFAARAAARD